MKASCAVAFTICAACGGGGAKRFGAGEAIPVAGAAFAASGTSVRGVTAEGPLSVERVVGEDAWSFAEPVTLGARRDDGTVIGWTSRMVVVIDVATGQIREALPLPNVKAGRVVVGAATDGVQVAAVLSDGTIAYWANARAAMVERAPAAVRAQAKQPVPIDVVASPHARGQTIRQLGVGRTGVARVDAMIAESAKRIAFSSDGTRLVAGAQIYQLPAFDALLDVAAGDVVLDADADGAVVATLVIERAHGEPGSKCGFVPSWEYPRLAGLEWRPVGGAAVAHPVAVRAIPSSASARDRWVAFEGEKVVHDVTTGAERPAPSSAASAVVAPMVKAPAITAIDVADDGAVAVVRQGGAFVVRGAQVTSLGVPIAEARRPRFQSVAFGRDGVTYAVVTEDRDRGERWMVEIDRTGGGRAWAKAGMTARVSRDGRAVVTDEDALRVRGFATRDVEVPFRAKNLHATDQGRVARDRVVVHDSKVGANLFAVIDGGRAGRTIEVAGTSSLAWDVAADGSTLATATEAQLKVVSLETGATTVETALDRVPWAIATSRSITAVADGDGLVRVWACGREATVDLKARADLARSIAISPDEQRIALGTGRGVAVVMRVDCARAP